MATKKIVAGATLHVPHKDFKPYDFDSLGNRSGGNYKIVEFAPGDVLDLDADEADALIALGRATLFEEKKAPEVQAPAGDGKTAK